MLEKIVHCSLDTFNQIIDGTHASEQYTDDHLYSVALGESVEVGATGSGTTINAQNQLVVSLLPADIPSIPLSKISDVTATASEINVLDGITATTQELNYTDGVTSNILTQLNDKVNTATTVNGHALTTNVTVTKSDVELGNVDNKSEATIKSDFTGSIASENTGFVTGGDAYTALNVKANSSDVYTKTQTDESVTGALISAMSYTDTKTTLVDSVTNKKYKLIVANGELSLEEVE